jgi:hypothetical protein
VKLKAILLHNFIFKLVYLFCFLYTGGKEIQKECSEFLDTKHSKAMDADEVYCSKAGKLKCKMVAHVGESNGQVIQKKKRYPF